MTGGSWMDAGKTLKELRNQRKLSVFKVAKEVHISGNYVSQIERGLKAPSDIVLHSLADFYGINKEELFSLYGRICEEPKSYILANPPFRRTITQISIDERLTDDEKNYLSEEIQKLYEDLLKSRKE